MAADRQHQNNNHLDYSISLPLGKNQSVAFISLQVQADRL